MRLLILPRAFLQDGKAAKTCPGCNKVLQQTTSLSAGGRVLGLCGDCETPYWEEETICRVLTEAERVEPGLRRMLAALRRTLNRFRQARAAEDAAELGHRPHIAPPVHGFDRRTALRQLPADDGQDAKAFVMRLLAEALTIDGTCLRYRPGFSDAAVAASASAMFAELVRQMAKEQKLRISNRQLSQALKDARVTAGAVAEARGSLGLPLRDPIAHGVVDELGERTTAMKDRVAALRVELGARMKRLFELWMTMGRKIDGPADAA